MRECVSASERACVRACLRACVRARERERDGGRGVFACLRPLPPHSLASGPVFIRAARSVPLNGGPLNPIATRSGQGTQSTVLSGLP